ncbi:unnamed protein product [Linum trigynum]|uniref:Uncharacterized protein n=1 Tax=Linum trigynum TaxID=586398 RepID=A0AAV2E8A9_9ROSI
MTSSNKDQDLQLEERFLGILEELVQDVEQVRATTTTMGARIEASIGGCTRKEPGKGLLTEGSTTLLAQAEIEHELAPRQVTKASEKQLKAAMTINGDTSTVAAPKEEIAPKKKKTRRGRHSYRCQNMTRPE